MRLSSLEIEGFRSFSEKVSLDCSGDVILITGANGTGKTSILDAILWGLCGTLPRLKRAQDKVLSLYSKFGYAAVTLTLVKESTGSLRISRRFDGTQTTLTVQEGNEQFIARKAENRLIELLWPLALSTEKSFETLADVLTHCVYLQQDLVRDFIEGRSDTERFQALSELVGAGCITDLQKQLESARLAWSRVTTQRHDKLQDTQKELEKLQQEVQRLGGTDTDHVSDLSGSWREWWQKVAEVGIPFDGAPAIEDADAPVQVDSVLRKIQAEMTASSRRIVGIETLHREAEGLQELSLRTEELSEAELALGEISRKREEVSQRLANAQTRAAEERRSLTELQDARQSLSSLATLALRHLGDTCPVCSQSYDRLATRQRLEQLTLNLGDPESGDTVSPTIKVLSDELAQITTNFITVETRYRQLVQRRDEYLALRRNALSQLMPLQFVPKDNIPLSTVLSNALEKLIQKDNQYKALYTSGEKLSLALSRLSEQVQRIQVQKDLVTVDREFNKQQKTYNSYATTRQTASKVIEVLREVGAVAVGSQIEQIAPLLDRIYARIVPHPAFTRTSLLTKYSQGKGRMDVVIGDPVSNIKDQDALGLLSSSQLNALAFSVFLSFNLATSSIPLEMAILDDPLQSLDDVNLLGLIDVLRRTRGKRQILITTHDPRFSQLLKRKLRPIESNQKTKVFTLQSWTRSGPAIISSEVASQINPQSLLLA